MTPLSLRAFLRACLALLVLLFLAARVPSAAAGASPSSTAASTLSNFHYELIDLTPGDDLLPWIDLHAQSGDMSAGVYFDAGEYQVDASARGFQHGSLDLAHRGNLAAGMTAADGASASVSMIDRSGFAYMASIVSFALSPYTRVVFSADATVASQLAPGAQRTWALAGLSGMFEDGIGQGIPLYSTLETAASGASAGTLSVSGQALGNRAGGHLVLFANTLVWASVAPVPEPAAPALLGAGVLLLAGIRRRKRAPQAGACGRKAQGRCYGVSVKFTPFTLAVPMLTASADFVT